MIALRLRDLPFWTAGKTLKFLEFLSSLSHLQHFCTKCGFEKMFPSLHETITVLRVKNVLLERV